MTNNIALFSSDLIYVVKKDFSKGSSSFKTKMQLKFVVGGYSWYDNAHAFEFVDLSNGQKLTWWLWDNEAPEIWEEYFEPMRG